MVRGLVVLGIAGIVLLKMQVPDEVPVCPFGICARSALAAMDEKPMQRIAEMKLELRGAPKPLAAVRATLHPQRRTQ